MSKYLWNVYCITESAYVTIVSDTAITTCPNNPAHTINAGSIAVIETRFADMTYSSFINIQSTLPGVSGTAITINASDPGGIITVTGGTGGITEITTGSYELTSGIGAGTTGGISITSSGAVQITGGTGGITETTIGTYQLSVGTGAGTTGGIIINPGGTVTISGVTGNIGFTSGTIFGTKSLTIGQTGMTGSVTSMLNGVVRVCNEIIYRTTPTTATWSDILNGAITFNVTGGKTLTFPTGSSAAAEIPNLSAGYSIELIVKNSAASGTITVAVSTGGTVVPSGVANNPIAVGAIGLYMIRFTSGTTYDLYKTA